MNYFKKMLLIGVMLVSNLQATEVILHTNLGNITLKLNQDKAPITVDNFLQYVNSGFYEGTIFHRVIGDFMIQGGGFDENVIQKKTNESIKNEANNGLVNDKYTIAMARTQVVDSATSQFFINLSDNDFLNHNVRDYGYAVFGEVIAGKEVVDKIGNVKTARIAGQANVPVENIVIEKVTVNKSQ